MPRERIVEHPSYYKLIGPKGESGPLIMKSTGTGRLFSHFIANKGKLVRLETIAKLSGWKNPIKQFRGFRSEIENWSPYGLQEIYSIGRDAGYILYSKNNS